MAAEEWYTPAAESIPVAQAPRARAAAYELRPLSLGEILDRTFSVYRSRFWLFVGIGAACAGLQALIGALQMLPFHLMPKPGAPPQDVSRPFGMTPERLGAIGAGIGIAFLVFMLVYMVAFMVTEAVTVFAVGEVYLGRETTIAESFRATYRKWYRYVGIGIWQAWSMMWIPVVALALGGVLMLGNTALKALGVFLMFAGLLGGFVGGVILALRNSLAVQATVIEQLPVRASMRRSKVLSDGAKGRVFVVGVLAVALNYAVGFLQMPLLFFVMFTIARGGRAVATEVATALVGFVGRAVVEPVLMIGISLVYFDQRVRMEALDIQILLGEEHAILAATPDAEVVPAEAAASSSPVAEAMPVEAPLVESAMVIEPVHEEGSPAVEDGFDTGRTGDAEKP